MTFYPDHDFDDELADLRQEARAQRAFSRRLCAHIDYRDPDYPEFEPEEEENDGDD